jgi:hypothetical protein
MHVAFVDESGDLGGAGSPTRHFILCAVVVRHDRWERAKSELGDLRHRLWVRHRLRLDAEIHAGRFLGGDTSHLGLDIRARFQCVHHILGCLEESSSLDFCRFAVGKGGACGRQVLSHAWNGLAAVLGRKMHGVDFPCEGRGWIIVMDHHGDQPYRDPVLAQLLESAGQPLMDQPFGRRSHENLFLQCADLLAFLTKQSLEPNAYFKAYRGRRLLRVVDRIFGGPCDMGATNGEGRLRAP